MKKTMKMISFLLVISMLAALFAACDPDAGTNPETVPVEENKIVTITVGAEAGAALASIPVSVTVDGQEVACRTEWTMLNAAGDAYEAVQGNLENGKDYRLNIYYNAGASVDDTEFDIQVTGAELSFSEMAGEEVKTVVRINLLEKGNLTIVSGSNMVGMPIEHAYCAVKLDGESLTITSYEWSILTDSGITAPAEGAVFEEGKYYQLHIYFIAPDGFDPDAWQIRSNCGEGTVQSIEAAGAEFVALVDFNYTGGEKPEAHTCNFVLNKNKPSTATCEQDGVTYYICSCGKEKTEAAKATGHLFDLVNETKPNCTENGVAERKCRYCGKGMTVISSADGVTHDYQQVDKRGSCDEGLVVSYKCSRCDASKTETLSPKEHAYGAAEYWSNFRCVRTCQDCGHQEIKAHVTDSNAICKNCGVAIIN